MYQREYFLPRNRVFRRWQPAYSEIKMCIATVEQTWRDVKKPYKGRNRRQCTAFISHLLSHDSINDHGLTLENVLEYWLRASENFI